MGKMKLTIQHNGMLYEPPVEEGVKIEWESTVTPGKLTFTTIKTSGVEFEEGDPVSFSYDNKKMFAGYIFKKKRDKEHRVEITCYDQLRYFKNKYTYVFEKKMASQIIQALCRDFGLKTGTLMPTAYIIPVIAEENISAMDIASKVLEETLLNTGQKYVLYDDAGKITLNNCATMISTNLIFEESAENFDYTSSIDDETYNSVVLYYKKDDETIQLYTAHDPLNIGKWGLLRYFEEVKNQTIAQNKANSLLKLHNKKTRELKVTGAFGDTSVRGGTLIPVKLDLGDMKISRPLMVQKVTHKFDENYYTMDLTLEGYW